MNLEKARFNMIQQQIRPWEVLDQRVLDAMRALPRDEFVPEAYRKLAYADTRIPIGEGQLMMTPKVEARIAQELRLTSKDKVLEVGTGSGFFTALLASRSRLTSPTPRPNLSTSTRVPKVLKTCLREPRKNVRT